MIKDIQLKSFRKTSLGMTMLAVTYLCAFVSAEENPAFKANAKNYRSIDLFTTAAQRHTLDSMRKQYWRHGDKVALYNVEKVKEEKNLENDEISFKGFIRRRSAESNIFVQTSKKRWLRRSEWEGLAESDGAEFRVNKKGKVLVLKPGQAAQ